jgi:phosphatidylserine/phosphatidylglycerophosphate/cardiolipin synthase-like enzyme
MSDSPIGAIPGITTIGGIGPLSPIAAIPRVPALGGNVMIGGTFRLDNLPPTVQQAFKKGGAWWRDAVDAAIAAGRKDLNELASVIFFMQHPERMTADGRKRIEENDKDFYKLRAEWLLYLTIVTRLLKPSTTPDIFLPERRSRNYEDFVTARTTGRITLMVNGRNWDGSGHKNAAKNPDGFKDEFATYDRMQETVESLAANDEIFIANWQFNPPELPLTEARSGIADWAALLASKAKEGVKIRVIIAQHPPFSELMSHVPLLDGVINALPSPDNFKYIVSAHPHIAGTHHQKFMVARKGKDTVAFCGGLDISFNRTPPAWWVGFVWHDVGTKLEGLIAHDLEREFVERWNRERAKSGRAPLAGWKPFEKLVQRRASGADHAAELNKHSLQMLRTVSRGLGPENIKRDDIWRGYFRLIGRATRFIYLENQYFYEPKLADAIVKQAEAQPGLVVIVVSGTGTDDLERVKLNATPEEQRKQQALVDITQNGFALRLEFFKRLYSSLSLTGTINRLGVYTLQYDHGITHTKLILVDDQALSVGSANANPRGFFFDSELNVMLDDPEAVKSFRERLWAHNLGVAPDKVAKWRVSEFITRWNLVAGSNKKLLSTPEKMVGDGVIPFKPLDSTDHRLFREGKRGPISGLPSFLGDLLGDPPEEALF